MAGNIIANAAAIKGTAVKFTGASVEATRIASTLDGLVGRLTGAWSGTAANTFQSSMGQIKAQLNVAVTDLQQTGQSLTEAAAAYEQFEQSIRSQVSA